VESVLEEIDLGVRESYSDVRELLLHFRTRTNTEDIEPALATTLAKVRAPKRHPTHLNMQGQGMPLHADLQIQVLHIVQEALVERAQARPGLAGVAGRAAATHLAL
jgi:two-component system nitrate/nitrite sensor histidine kinase NarX